MKTKTFDCVALKHRGADLVEKEIHGLTLEQELVFWQQKTQQLKIKQHKLQPQKQSGNILKKPILPAT